MFVYIVFALGKLPHPVKSRVALGLCGIVIVAMSAAGAIGVVSYFGACCGENVCCAVPLQCVPHQPCVTAAVFAVTWGCLRMHPCLKMHRTT